MSGRADPTWCRWDGPDLVLRLHVQPGAATDAVLGPHGDRLRVRIQAPPVDGKANARLRAWLAEAFALPRSRIEIVAGHSGRFKRVRVEAPGALPEAIAEHCRRRDAGGKA